MQPQFSPMSIDNLNAKIAEFLQTKDDYTKEEWYATDRSVYDTVLTEFIEHLDSYNAEREKRRKLYEELKKEFGDN
jgi:hypothetical protein